MAEPCTKSGGTITDHNWKDANYGGMRLYLKQQILIISRKLFLPFKHRYLFSNFFDFFYRFWVCDI
jgi:hypothetical protein